MQAITTNFGYGRPLGYQQILTAALASADALTLPAVVAGIPIRAAIIQCNGGTVRWRDDGTSPTASIGMSLATGQELDYYGEITAIQFISSSGSPILDISYYA